ncbi:GAF domain-containing sensor histidine kinase [Kitasatospora sp. NPDC057015]|uniref:sensor histidine kinase n=1 Tax=Kitasatospora sp. NPDC057015 TaxID=3346001 RepID=UPI00362CE163
MARTPDSPDQHDDRAQGGPAPAGPPPSTHRVPEIASLGLDTLVTEVAERLQSAAAVTDRMQRLLEAVVSVGAGLDLHATLQRIAIGAAELVDARYAALGVISPTGHGLADFIHVGVDEETAARIGELPAGRGILGALIDRPEPLRLTDLAEDPRSAGFPPHHPPMTSFLGEPIRVRGEVFGNIYLTEKTGGGAFTPEDEQVLHALAAAAGVAIENSRLYEEGRRRERWIAGANAVTTALLSTDEAQVALTVAAEQVRGLAGAALGMILLPTGDGQLRVSHASGEAAEFVTGELVPQSGFAARLLAGESVYLDDMSGDPTVEIRLARTFGPSMAVPMVAAGRVLGALGVWRSKGAASFTDAEKQLAQTFASQAALALRLAEGQRDQQRLAVFQDRDRIARDLHDLVIQRLFATGMMLESAARRAVVPEVQTGIGRAVDELDATIQEVRTTIYALQHDGQGGDEPDTLRTRVLREGSQAAAALGFKPSVAFTGPVESLVGEKAGRQLLAALREMLSNTARHARASRVRVDVDATVHLDDEGHPVPGDPESLERSGRPGVLLSVTDDGVGIPAGGRRSGLRNLARRAEALGGDAWHEPGPYGKGTSVRWTARL